jgi:hypothetical protein
MRLIAALSLSICIAGCAGTGTREARCERPSDPPAVLDVKDPAAQRHLRDDGRTAESAAVRYADAMEGDTPGQHRQMLERCEATLLADIARVHHVAPEQLRVAIARQNDTPF